MSRTLRKTIAAFALFCMTMQSGFAALLNLSQAPLFLGSNIPPKVMLTISKDQQLFKKAYNDYSDLDGDGAIETTYKHSIDYYGYFDSYKCYTYSTTNGRFEPAAVTADKYCTSQWSGNFLNWVSMARIDAVRKLLYGGMRSTDQTFASGGANAATVLERSYLPTDAHAWAKYYNGADMARLTPFNPASAAPSTTATTSSSFNIPGSTGDYSMPFTTAQNANVAIGDQVRVTRSGNSAQGFWGVVTGFSNSNKTLNLRINATGVQGSGQDTSWVVTNESRYGFSFCNLTPGTASGSDSRSATNTQAPLIRVAQGNYMLWSANERWQCQWSEAQSNLQGGFAGGLLSNGNQAALSELYGSAENPSQTAMGLGTGSAAGEYIARVQVCVPSLLGQEKCKQYPSGNYKPIGLLQDYGDRDQIHFGLMTGSYVKNISGGVLRKNIGTFTDEINETTDGTFVQPYRPPNAPRTQSSSATTPGIVNSLNYLRIYGYLYSDGTYIGSSGDNCTYQLTSITENSCTSWGNPMSEIFLESVRYLAGKTATPAYSYASSSATKDNELGLPIATWTDPMAGAAYCSPMNVVVFNASVSTNDEDLRATTGTDFNAAASTIAALTNAVGSAEGITGGSYFIGKMLGSSPTSTTDAGFELCTAKTIGGLGDASGICPEGPTTAGSYLMGGIAHRAHTNRIRTDITVPSNDAKSLKVTSYGIQLATNVPRLAIPVPGSTTGQQVVIQPIYRLNVGGANGGGSIVDLKYVRQSTNGLVSTGKVYVNWEDSEQGGDYDQDMWGTIEWTLDASTSPTRLTVTTNAITAATSSPQGFGYTVSGTTKDGAHFHSGIYGFNYTDPTGVLGCANCNLAGSGGQTGPQSVTYNLGSNAGSPLQDPLWYLAKYGAFNDTNNNSLPDQQVEWDTKLADGSAGQDGVPDNYFLVNNPLGLEAALDRAFVNILAQATAASVATNSSSLQTTSQIYQARFSSTDWSGQLMAVGVNSDGSLASSPAWDAAEVINTQSWSSRTILTYNNTATVRRGVPFRWPSNPVSPTAAEISSTLVTALNTNPDTNLADARGSSRVQYLRGNGALEVGAQRFRARPTSKLGDIVNSDPAYVAVPNAQISDASYAAFVLANVSRTAMLYVGANDGMLHGFDATTGQEKLAYVPSKTFPNLNKLTSLAYSHRYYVDGSPEVQDAYIGGSWRTALVGGLGGGGHGLYALDVTSPSAFSETNASNIVLWEFNDTDDADLGYVYGKPAIRKMANGRWAAIVSGGYHSQGDSTVGTGHAVLFVIFLDGPTGANRTWVAGTDYIKIDTGTGTAATPNALGAPFAVDADLNGTTDFVYAGDLLGNFWKFDLTSATTANWGLAANRVSLFQATDSLGNAQPITAQPEGTLHPTGRGFVLTFGTGKYIETTDPSGPYKSQSFYGIWDKNDSPGNVSTQTRVTSRTQLLQQTMTDTTSGATGVRVLSQTAAVWSTDTTPPTADDSPTRHIGWLIDFPSGATTGERSVFRPLIIGNRLIFTTLMPSAAVCAFGGSSYMFVVDPATGGRIDGSVLDIDGNGLLNAADKVTVAGAQVYASGVESKVGIMPTPTIVMGSSGASSSGGSSGSSQIYGTTGPLREGYGALVAYAIGGGSTGGRNSAVIGLGALSGRVSWREVLSR